MGQSGGATALVRAGRSAQQGRGAPESSLDDPCHQVQLQFTAAAGGQHSISAANPSLAFTSLF